MLILTTVHHNHVSLVASAKIKKMDFLVFVCLGMQEKFVTKVRQRVFLRRTHVHL